VTPRDALRIAAGILAGLALASLPFLQYGVRTHRHHHASVTPQSHTHHHHAHEGDRP
jgi:hypothetical protein